jgi:hypothetical protein
MLNLPIMAILLKNASGTASDCNELTKAFAADPSQGSSPERAQDTNVDLNQIRQYLRNYQIKLESASDPVIRNFAHATSFPVADLMQIMQNNPESRYIRIYNGLTEAGEYVTYCAPISDSLQNFTEQANSIISESCCHCKPCRSDTLLNQ